MSLFERKIAQEFAFAAAAAIHMGMSVDAVLKGMAMASEIVRQHADDPEWLARQAAKLDRSTRGQGLVQ